MKNTAINKAFARVGDIRIAYQVSGEGPPLICSHPMGWDQSLWDDHRDFFSRHFTLITFDQRGSGDSTHPEFSEHEDSPYTTQGFGDDLCAVLDALNIDKAHVMGYSMGAVSALQFATTAPARVDKLVLVSAMASRLPEDIIKRARQVEDVLDSEGLEKTYEFYFSGSMFEGEASKSSFRPKIEKVMRKATPHGFKGCFRVTIDRPSLIERLGMISSATLVLAGERDRHYVSEAERLVERIENAQQIIMPDSGHALTAQQPRNFENAVLSFLNE